jgi:hypothetical protein
MENSKLIALLKTFNTLEINRLIDFVRSPFFNKNEELIPFIEYLAEYSPAFPAEKLEKERVFAKLYPGQAFDAKKMSYLMNYLLKLGECYLGILGVEARPILSQYHTLRECANRGLEKHFHFLYEKWHEQLERQPCPDAENFYFRHRYAEMYSDFVMVRRKTSFDAQLQGAADNLDQYYFLSKLKFSCEMLNRQKIFSVDYQLPFSDEVQSHLATRGELPVLTAIYLRIFQVLNEAEGDVHFLELMDLLRRYGDSIDKEELRLIYLYAINFSVRNIRKGRKEYISIALDLYLEGIRRRALFENNYLTHWTYANVIKLALMQARYDWIEAFMTEYSSYLPPRMRDDALHYNQAELYFHKKDYDRVLNHLRQLQFTDLQYHLGSRVILVKTYYELGEMDSLFSLLASFSVYLRRNQSISSSLKKTCLNFCNLLNQALNCKAAKRQSLKAKIRQMEPLMERTWLEKVVDKGWG